MNVARFKNGEGQSMQQVEMRAEVDRIRAAFEPQLTQWIHEGGSPIAMLAALAEMTGDFGLNFLDKHTTKDFFREMMRQVAVSNGPTRSFWKSVAGLQG